MSVKPNFVGQAFKDTNTGNIWYSNSTTAGDWTLDVQDIHVGWEPTTMVLGDAIGFFTYGDLPGFTKLVFMQSTSIAGFDIESTNDLTEIDFPNLVTVDPTNIQTGLFWILGHAALTILSAPLLASVPGNVQCINNPLLTSVNFASLQTVGGSLRFDNNSLTSINLPSLVTVSVAFHCESNTGLTTLNVPLWVPTNGKSITAQGCALNAASIQMILRRCVLAGVTTCSIDLSGGTNAGITALNAQGQADVVTLGAQLTINP